MTTLPKDWYVSALKIGVMNDLENNPEIKETLGRYSSKFIKWAAVQRVTYENDIQEELEEFTQKFINKRLYNTDGKLWRKISKEVFERDSFSCFYCRKVGGILEVDHYIPISKGGTNDLSNLKTSCRRCNRQKKDKLPEEFEKWREDNG